jgi:hypothetical protein
MGYLGSVLVLFPGKDINEIRFYLLMGAEYSSTFS